MDKCLKPHAHHCCIFSSKYEIIDLFRLFPGFLTLNVTIYRFLVAISRLKVRQNSMTLQGQMITYMSQWSVIFTLFFCRRLNLIPFIIANLSHKSMRTSRINRCEPRYAGTKFTNRVVTWFCYELIAKPGNETATVLWTDPYELQSSRKR